MQAIQLWFDMILRAPKPSECELLSDLCLRSKAHWGYDPAFLAACRDELSLTEDSLQNSQIVVGEIDGQISGLAQLDPTVPTGALEKLFVAPEFIGQGVGRLLFDWVVTTARATGITSFTIDGDPNSVAFYLKMGAIQTGSTPSGSIKGRMLPQFRYDFQSA
ncbi:MAG: GNAT family N-acetyltransferase [Hyphomicrobiales bacterium]